MSAQSSPSRTCKVNVKMSKITRSSTLKSKTSRKMSFRAASNMFCENWDKIQGQRPTLRADIETTGYEKLKVSSNLQFFRDDFGGISAIRFLQDTEKVAVGFNSGELQICPPVGSQTKSGPFESIIKGWEGNDSISCIQYHPKSPNVLYASSTAGTVMRRDLEDVANYNDFFISEAGNEIYSMDFTGDCQLVTAGRDATVRIYNVSVGSLVGEFGRRVTHSDTDSLSTGIDGSFHEKRIYCVRCHPSEPSTFVTGGWDGVKVWDSRTQAAVRSILGPFIYGDSVDICGGTILTGSCVASDCLQLWDLGSGFLIENINPVNKRVYLYGELPYVAKFYKGASGDLVLCGVGGLQLISIAESSILYFFEDDKPVSAVDSIDKNIAFGGKSHSVLYGKVASPGSEISCTMSFASGRSDHGNNNLEEDDS